MERRGIVAPHPVGIAPFRIEGQSVELWTDHERNRGGNEANLAFGTAWLAVKDVTQAAADVNELSDEAQARLVELRIAHDQLRGLFAAGSHAAVCELALSIVVLADRISMLIE